MAYTGQSFSNPVSGERITFLQTAADTDGALLEFELELTADGHVPGAHVHPEQEERFHVLEGEMTFRLGLRKIVATAGETVVVPAGRVHKFANKSGAPVAPASRSSPRSTWRISSTTTAELAIEGNTNRKGMPKPLHLALFVGRFRARGPRPVPAGAARPRADGPARRDRAQARPRGPLRVRDVHAPQPLAA